MDAFGDRLRHARETKGLPLETIAEATRIARRHLVALERGDLDSLPAGPFARGYIRSYAEYLGVDPLPLLEAYRSEARRRGQGESEARDRVIEEMSQLVARRAGAAERSRPLPLGPRGIAVAVAAACALGVAAWLFIRSPGPADAVAASKPGTEQTDAPRGHAPESGLPSAGSHPGSVAVAPVGGPTAAAPAAEPDAPARPTPPAPSPATPRVPSDLRVSDSGVGTDVRNNRLVGRADRFTPGIPVVFWTRVLGGRKGDAIRHVWFHEGHAVMRADLELGGSHWRTYSRLDLPPRAIGSWAVEARDADGRLLARLEFQCVRDVR